ncbi:MAG: hypothetical protein ACHQ4J_05565, partial [Candidatus Binatia bacterium]
MGTHIKLHVKLGAAEFSAEGPEAVVNEQYRKFLEAFSSSPTTPDHPQSADGLSGYRATIDK